MSHNGDFFFCVSFSPSLLRSFAQLRHTHKPSHGRDTCAMLHNTRKATLNRIGRQRKKRGYKGGASYTYEKVRWCQTSGDVDEDGVKRLVKVPGCRCCCHDVDVGAVLLGTNKGTQKLKPEHTSMPNNLGQKGLTKVVSR
jgi:hypothetical protein